MNRWNVEDPTQKTRPPVAERAEGGCSRPRPHVRIPTLNPAPPAA